MSDFVRVLFSTFTESASLRSWGMWGAEEGGGMALIDFKLKCTEGKITCQFMNDLGFNEFYSRAHTHTHTHTHTHPHTHTHTHTHTHNKKTCKISVDVGNYLVS